MFFRILLTGLLAFFGCNTFAAEAKYFEVSLQASADNGISLDHTAIVEIGKKVRVAKIGVGSIRLDYTITGLSIDETGAPVVTLDAIAFNRNGTERWSLAKEMKIMLFVGKNASSKISSGIGVGTALHVKIDVLTEDVVRARFGGVIPESKACPDESAVGPQTKSYCPEWPCVNFGEEKCCSKPCSDGSGGSMSCCGAVHCCACGACCRPAQ